MQLSDIPAKFTIPFADSAVAPFIRTIPIAPSGTPGQASLQTGFPQENFSPVAAGGVPPFGEDFNGIFNQTTAWNLWQATGVAAAPYDATWQTAVNGYPKYALVSSLVSFPLIFMSIVDNNVTNPDTGGAGWIVFWRQLIGNQNLYVNASTGNDSNNGTSTATAKRTIGAAVTTAWTFTANSQFTVTINVAPGTYNEAVATPGFIGPATIITGSSGNPADVTVQGGNAGSAIQVSGPNTLTVSNVRVGTTGAGLNGFNVLSGATMITSNTQSIATGGAIFAASSSGTLVPGAHASIGASAWAYFFAQTGGVIDIPTVTYTVGANISFSFATVHAESGGIVNFPSSSPATFTIGGNTVTGARFTATVNGVILQAGLGANYLPGSAAGSTSSGGQCIT
jgi:hypothetical protein